MVSLRIPHKRDTDFIGHVHPLVHVGCKRIRQFHPSHQMFRPRGESGKGSERSVHMKPKFFLPAEFGQRRKVVDGAGIHRSRITDDTCRTETFRPVLRDSGPQRVKVDPVVRIDSDRPQSASS